MYGGNPARSNVSSAAAAIGSPAIAWHAHLDGAVYGQPLVIGGTVIVATEGDMVYALAAGTGQVRWQRHAGTPVPLSALPCGNIDPLGITSTPVYDRADGLVYAVAETAGYHHVLVGISVADGRVRVERDIPAPDGHPRYDQQRPGLLVMGGYVYVAFGGLYGDCGPYRGSVVAVPSSGRGAILSYVVPTAREGAIWGVSGPVLSGGDLYVSDGNGSVSATSFDGTDAVVALSPSLRRLDTFAPSSWKADSAGDADLGSTQPALIGSGRLLALGKSGTAYLLNTRHLGGVGGQIASLPVCSAYGGSAVSGPVVYEPCESGGLAAVSTAAGKLRVLWRGPASAQGSPVVAGGAVWVADYGGGTLYALSPSSGSVLATLPLGTSLPHFVSMSASGSYGFIGANDGVIAVSGV
jgi:outer membrane protein assembly factor BamB